MTQMYALLLLLPAAALGLSTTPSGRLPKLRGGGVVSFAKDRAPGLAVAGTIGLAAEHVAGVMPISLSPLL